jgi:hypothetical protein
MPAYSKTRPLPPEVREKLGKVLPLLSSNHEGERIGAVAAIERILKAAGFDWHDFTGWMTAASPSPPPQYEPPPRRQASNDGELVFVDSDKVIERIEEMRACCSFSARSEEFLDSLLERANTYVDVRFTLPMKKWFCDLERQAARRRT